MEIKISIRDVNTRLTYGTFTAANFALTNTSLFLM
jgi:hypothetical protein